MSLCGFVINDPHSAACTYLVVLQIFRKPKTLYKEVYGDPRWMPKQATIGWSDARKREDIIDERQLGTLEQVKVKNKEVKYQIINGDGYGEIVEIDKDTG